jgi:hypothetical protein
LTPWNSEAGPTADLEETMQSQTENKTSNIVSLFARKDAEKVENKEAVKAEDASTSFFDAMRKNSENEERLRKERLKANQSVLKSYRIKN